MKNKINNIYWVCDKLAIPNINECKNCQKWLISNDPFIADIADELAEERIADEIAKVNSINFCV